MNFFQKVREGLRDKTRDEFCAGLQSLGIAARLAPRKLPEEELKRQPSYRCLGIIDIPDGKVRWVNVQLANGEGQNIYTATYGVPDTKINASFPKVSVKSIRVREPRYVGAVVGLEWSGNDFGLGVIDQLADKQWPQLMRSRNDVELMAHPDHGCWTISHGMWSWTFPWGRWGRANTPSDDDLEDDGLR